MTAPQKWNVAIIGATGLVGREMLSILEERKFPIKKLFLFASENTAGTALSFNGKSHIVEFLDEAAVDQFSNIDIALLSAGNATSRLFAPLIAKKGTVCIDNSNAWRADPAVPLVVPEVNYAALSMFDQTNIIANPNCSTIQMVQVLKPIHDAYRIKRVVVSTYQSTSGTGKTGMDELAKQTIGLLNQETIETKAFPHQIAFNCIPHIDKFQEDGYTLEEAKMISETKKILNAPSMNVTATCVRVPVFSSHSESINIETEKKATADDIRNLLGATKGLKIVDDPAKNLYPLNIDAAGKNDTFVGRIREDSSVKNGLDLWVVSDNLRKGAALNAVQIAEALILEHLPEKRSSRI